MIDGTDIRVLIFYLDPEIGSLSEVLLNWKSGGSSGARLLVEVRPAIFDHFYYFYHFYHV